MSGSQTVSGKRHDTFGISSPSRNVPNEREDDHLRTMGVAVLLGEVLPHGFTRCPQVLDASLTNRQEGQP